MDIDTRTGILAAGNWIVDQVKMIDVYPEQEKLSNILSECTGHGGAPFNVLTALHKMNASVSLGAIGVLGEDERGDTILQECRKMGIDTTQLRRLPGTHTSYTDVMTATDSGKRTFFHRRGANALLEESHFDFSHTNARIFHLGYLLLLDRLDEIKSDGQTGASAVFRQAKKAGLMTSVDIVSEQSNRYKEVVASCMPYVDIFFSNDYEAQMLTGIKITGGESDFEVDRVYEAAEIIIDKGVLRWVVIHFPRGVVAMNKKKESFLHPAVKVPSDKIKGSVGAGDALAAGVLYGIHENWKMRKSLALGVSAAAMSLLEVTATESMKPWRECMAFGKQCGYKQL